MIDNALYTPSEADITFIGVNYYETCGEKGKGPELIVKALNTLSSYNIKAGRDAFNELRISDAGVIKTTDYSLIERKASRLVREIKGLPLILGGEHTITLPFIKAIKPRRVLIFDAHADMFDTYNGRKISYATVTKRVSELVEEVYLTGVRDLTITEAGLLKNSNVKIIKLKDAAKLRGELYVSVDLDIIDPSEMPEVSTPVPLGVNYQVLVKVLNKVLLNKKIVGLDVTELTAKSKGLSSINAGGLIMNYLKRRCC